MVIISKTPQFFCYRRLQHKPIYLKSVYTTVLVVVTHKSGEGLEGMYYEEAMHVDDSSGDTQLIPVSTAHMSNSTDIEVG